MIILETLFPGTGAGGIRRPAVKERKSYFVTCWFCYVCGNHLLTFHDKTVNLDQQHLPWDVWESQTENGACFELDSADFRNFIHNG